MRYLIALDPDLPVTPAQVADHWNQSPAAQEAGPIQPDPDAARHYDLASAGLVVVTSLSLSVFGSMIYDMVKQLIYERTGSAAAEPEVQIQQLPDGTQLVVVILREESS